MKKTSLFFLSFPLLLLWGISKADFGPAAGSFVPNSPRPYPSYQMNIGSGTITNLRVSTITINGTTYNWQAGVGSYGQCLTTDGASPIPTITWGPCTGGTPQFLLLEDDTFLLLEDDTKLITQ